MSEISFKVKIGESVYDFTASLEETLTQLKHKLTTLTEFPNFQQRWIYKGKVLSNDQTVRLIGLSSGDTIIVSINPQAVNSSPQPSSTISSEPIPSSTVLQYAQSQFDQAMFNLFQNNQEQVMSAVSTLCKISNNIVANPMEEKFRKIPRTNAAFNKKVGSIIGGEAVMQTLGFQVVGGEWVLFPSPQAWEHLIACKAKLDRFLSKLEASSSSSSLASSSLGPIDPSPPSPTSTSPLVPSPSPSTSDLAVMAQLVALALGGGREGSGDVKGETEKEGGNEGEKEGEKESDTSSPEKEG